MELTTSVTLDLEVLDQLQSFGPLVEFLKETSKSIISHKNLTVPISAESGAGLGHFKIQVVESQD